MESDMENMTSVKKQMKLQISKQQDKLKACSHVIKKKEQIILSVNRIIKKFQIDIHYVSEYYQDPVKLKEVVKVSTPEYSQIMI